jgi:hypothetical protein
MNQASVECQGEIRGDERGNSDRDLLPHSVFRQTARRESNVIEEDF